MRTRAHARVCVRPPSYTRDGHRRRCGRRLDTHHVFTLSKEKANVFSA